MLLFPKIPENITVHLGAPDANTQNVVESFPDYIKNVASSEIYPTWPKEAIKANVYAQISVALNRIYTEFYRSMGKNFDITSSPAYDQTYIYQRNIFKSISDIVDEIFDGYIKREGFLEPLFAGFCDGLEVNCDGLSQWGSLTLAEDGLNHVEILKKYYGNDIELITDVPVENIEESAPKVPLKEGDTGKDVELLQIKLNRISGNFPGIPKIFPTDGFFDKSTTDAVKKFQEVFDLTVDGIVGRSTWYRIQLVYNGVKKLHSLESEGIKLDEISTQYPDELSEGAASSGVIALQYYLSYISLFVQTVTGPNVDGIFGPETKNAVISFQKTYGLEPDGIVDREVWNSIENIYYSLIASVDIKYKDGLTIPFPGRVLRIGIEGDDVRVLQEYLNFISRSYPSIGTLIVDGSYGQKTANAVREFKRLFNVPGNPERVSPETWKRITDVYDDLFNGARAFSGQYPGYEIS